MKKVYIKGYTEIRSLLGARNNKVYSFWDETGEPSKDIKTDYHMTYEEIGKALNVTKTRARQICESALSKLKHPKRSAPLKQFL